MAILNVHVIYPSAVLPASEANASRMFVFSGTGANANGTGPYGNLGRRNNNTYGETAYNLNNPMIAGAIAVTSYQDVKFDSADFTNDQSLMGAIAAAIDRGYIEVHDMAAPGVPLTRTELAAFV